MPVCTQVENPIKNIEFLLGSAEILEKMTAIKSRTPFSDEIIEFFDKVSKKLLTDKEVRKYPDIVTYAFWIRKASVLQYKRRLINQTEKTYLCLGRGIVFHIAPSNVAVNYAYSLTVGLLCGNKNIVRVSSKEFEQIKIINSAFLEVLNQYPELKKEFVLVRYGHEQSINDFLSALADVRVVWGGDRTIEEIRKSPLPFRAKEITFADRYSIAVIDSDFYLEETDAVQAAQKFYNDTYLTDQNACTSPKIILWLGNHIQQAKEKFWEHLYELVQKQYQIQSVQAVNKLTSMYLLASRFPAYRIEEFDNRLVRVQLKELNDQILNYLDNSGYFYEYELKSILELEKIITKKCQTIGYIGKKEIFSELLESGIDGVDRIVPIGKTMDFDFIWDGYDLFAEFTRKIMLL